MFIKSKQQALKQVSQLYQSPLKQGVSTNIGKNFAETLQFEDLEVNNVFLFYYVHIFVKKSRIRETKHLSTDADSSTNAIGGWTKAKSAQKKLFFARIFQTTSKQKCSNVGPFLSITFPQGFQISKNIGHPTWGSGGTKTVKRYLKSEKSERKKLFLRGDFRQFSNKNVHI